MNPAKVVSPSNQSGMNRLAGGRRPGGFTLKTEDMAGCRGKMEISRRPINKWINSMTCSLKNLYRWSIRKENRPNWPDTGQF
ncbi:MAG: hypothetical protein CEE38_14460 [Planctomycetes bacterium B3_Pla]|nr:MAG: hypothetical protein CEE38_14460 [Planctomycetes bacterium B3_Pla]